MESSTVINPDQYNPVAKLQDNENVYRELNALVDKVQKGDIAKIKKQSNRIRVPSTVLGFRKGIRRLLQMRQATVGGLPSSRRAESRYIDIRLLYFILRTGSEWTK